MRIWAALLIVAAGLLGASGVAGSAAAAHGNFGPNLATASSFMLLHAAPILALSLITRESRWLLACATLLAFGAILFGGEVAAGALLGRSPLPMAAPTGGSMTILGWLGLAGAGVGRFFAR